MTIRDRRSGELYEEHQVAQRALRILYGSWWGRLLRPLLTNRLASEVLAWPRRMPQSARQIADFCAEFGVSLDEVVRPPTTPRAPYGWRSFADFFIRDWAPQARPVAPAHTLISPADGKLAVGTIDADGTLRVKGVDYTVAKLLGSEQTAAKFAGGIWFVIRLTVDDVHQYLWTATGRVTSTRSTSRRLHTVGPWGDGLPVLLNQRQVTVIETVAQGLIAQIEVGAILVGQIRNTHPDKCERGAVKGRFELGGSTIVVLCQNATVEPDPDLVHWSDAGVETRVQAGERIGIWL